MVAQCGVGIWIERWSLEEEDAVLRAEEIAEKVNAAMADEVLTEDVARVHEAAVRAPMYGGTSYRSLAEFVRGAAANAV